ncbi:hypothetical protein PV396_15620 [Streptomyces sp. ME02-8801-2C]|uniref:hypothetical protein n=1 Tax=Streptomyces sp. ME02-8801-2C TaxID=3028680 RepID=UPI00299FB433|nr:hypothetical protein [Streptomyces sp. ME02-8801-2C]MDX3453358.1 hypothetical protein [Streptomyces sp. ME02-8801-2C]
MSTSTHRPRTSAKGRPRTSRPTAPARRTVPLWLITVAALLAATAIAAAVLLSGTRPSRPATPPAPPAPPLTAVAATIDGQDIPVRELALYLVQERAATFTHFRQKYGAEDGPDFWTTEHDGQTPAAYLRERALADVTRTTVELTLAHRQGLLADSGYDAFLRNWQTENARRLKAVTAHQVIYGPVQYTESNYFTYVLSNLAAALQNKLTETRAITTSDDALRTYFTAHPGDFPHQSFTTAHDSVHQSYVLDRYRALIERLAGSAQVRVDRAVFDAVPVD